MIDQLPEIECLWLYGSSARGDATEGSDVDVLALTDTSKDKAVRAVRDHFRGSRKLDVSVYSRAGISRLIEGSSLFAWHLRLEGKPLLDRSGWLSSSLLKMGPYWRHSDDLGILHRLLQEVESDVGRRETAVYDAGVLFLVARNVGIIMSHHLGSVSYSPYVPLTLTRKYPPFPLTNEEYLAIYKARTASERGGSPPVFRAHQLRRLYRLVEDWLLKVEERVSVR